MASNELVLSRKASISLQIMTQTSPRLLPRIPAAALSAGLATRNATAVDTTATPTEARAHVLVETRNGEATGNELTRINAKRIKQVVEGFISAEIAVADAEKIFDRDEVKKVHALKTKRLLMDRALVDGGVLGSNRLVSQTGQGVLVAIVDSGFDLNHPMFRDSQNAIKDQHTSELAWTPEYGFGKISAARLIPQTGAQPAVAAVAGIRAASAQPRKRNRAVGKKQAAARHSGVRKVKKQAR